MTSFTDKGVPIPKENFTGTVWVNMNVKPDEGYNVNIGTVTFEARARTNWHTHATLNVLLFGFRCRLRLLEKTVSPVFLFVRSTITGKIVTKALGR